MKQTGIDIHIDEVIHHGLLPGVRETFQQSVESELARLIAEEGVPPALSRDPDAAASNSGTAKQVTSFPVGDEHTSRVARAIYDRLHGDLSQ